MEWALSGLRGPPLASQRSRANSGSRPCAFSMSLGGHGRVSGKFRGLRFRVCGGLEMTESLGLGASEWGVVPVVPAKFSDPSCSSCSRLQGP